MYLYDEIDQSMVDQRVAQYRDQTNRFLAGELPAEEFQHLRLRNGLYIQRLAPMLRIAVPYGMISATQLRKIAHISRQYDRGYAHFTTRQNIQFNWPILEQVPDLLAELDLLEILPAELAYDGLRDIGGPIFTKSRNRTALRVGMFGSAEYNHITVPSSEEKKLEEELQRYAMGYGGGLSLGLELGRFEIETGAIYAARQYPVGLLYVNGSVGSGLQGQRLEASELNIINVPLHFRYSFLRRGNWRAYALTGVSLQVAFQRNYFITDEPQYDFRPMQAPPMPAPSAGDEPAIDRIRKSGLGWFEGGTFEENAYLTGNLGLGLERYINSRWSLFLQPTYQHSLQYFRVGLGPNADQINSLSILFGAKVRVK